MPGKSVMVTSLSRVYLPSFFSTVTPGQLPTYWLAPVRSLNIVVLPQFGLPARAMQIPMIYLSCESIRLLALFWVSMFRIVPAQKSF